MKTERLFDRYGAFTVVPNSFIKRIAEFGPEVTTLLVYLRYRSGTGDTCYPSYDTIRKDTGMCNDSISKAIHALESSGYLEKKKRFSNSTVYILTMPAISDAELEESPAKEKKPVLCETEDSKKNQVPPVLCVTEDSSLCDREPVLCVTETNKTQINKTQINKTQEEGANEFAPPPSPIPVGEVDPFGVTEPAAPTTIEDYFKKQKPATIQESGSEKSSGSAGGLIKNEGAFRALQRFEEKKGKIDVSRYPEDVRPVVYRFCQLSGMVPPEPSRKKGGEYSLWISSCRELLEAAGEFGPAAMEAVFKDRERERNPYSVYSPKSVVNAVRAKAGVLRMESKKKASDEGITMTDAEVARVEKETQEMMQAYFASIERKPQHDNLSV